MTIEQTRHLIHDLFRQGPMHPVHQAAGRRVSQDELERMALLDPGFGGHLVQWFLDADQPLPESIQQPAWTRANRFLREPGAADPDVKMALAYGLNLPQSGAQGDLLKGILLCPGSTVKSAADLLRLDEEVVALFESLHWNVVDRQTDRAYVARLCGWNPGGPSRGSPLLLAAKTLQSPEAVLALAGVEPLDPAQSETLLGRVRINGLAEALSKLAQGRLGKRDNPELRPSLNALAERQKAKANRPAVGGGDISPAEAVQMVMERLLRRDESENQSHDPVVSPH